MAKKTIYSCQNCGAQSYKWLGRCPECAQWNTYVEEVQIAPSKRAIATDSHMSAIPISQVESSAEHHFPTGIDELDRVLGGGYTTGGAVLVGGDPGIGKSTLLMQATGSLSKSDKTLYISGEESPSQIKQRAERLETLSDNLFLLAENNVERIIAALKKETPKLVVIDSIQTLFTDDIQSAPGTVSQVRETAARLIQFTKKTGTALLIIGHVTKDGSIAGPKILEHMVDTVLYFEGERGHPYRILRTIKNRFGATNEIGVFEMTGLGLKEVTDPSGLFLAERAKATPGSVVVAPMEGSRPVLLEVQSLVAQSPLANPRRTAIGIENSRLALLVAVLEKVIGIPLYNQDIYLNVAGGMRIVETSGDLGVIAAIHSSFMNKPLNHETIMVGEVGLTGEVRAVIGCDTRLKEAQKLGFKRAIIPKSNLKSQLKTKIEVLGAATVEEALEMAY
ncbi:MAG: DNA repair protein RadA [Pseudomonadota bacterium]